MDKFLIKGGQPLKGNIAISGSKNAALPLMAAGILADGPVTISNIPGLNDIYTFNNVVRVTGTRVTFDEEKQSLNVDPAGLYHYEAPYDLVRKMRASFYMTGALLGAVGYARVSLPGGCAWGPRPVNLHLEGFRALGANIDMDGGYVIAEAPGGRLPGGSFEMKPSSVGATVNLVLAAVRAKGTSVIRNAAMEPDVVNLCHNLNRIGAKIHGAGTPVLEIEGVESLSGGTLDNIPDRIETGTFMIAAAMIPDSDVTLTRTSKKDLGSFPETFAKTGASVSYNDSDIRVKAPDRLPPVSIETTIYPGFPTDLQAQWATMMTGADGKTTVTDHIYPDRFSYVPELARLGAQIERHDNTAVIKGPQPLKGASVMSTDLRASVSLVMAGLAASGETEVLRVYHLDRGYETLEDKLNAVGADIKRVSE
ncbi:UDP-N-acetylglucosamine 1-carboxyvinyltransferase [Natronogracilivirga saccharolytica]|uniref:UDP-N-acetylglucosamine 1-carboxyvinyltransferase n=1 Tax=Natronogracilivirga saccharolytica TaxID=2812953 RepID=A0A8J7S9P0_9BACT|nr:UDP-N-acetylglucosamine 1-carboxyvinyltransferase [Natronogracilivirga saccharolytica]MBP3192656.1 UDP-N-acetylglucosamine 1-carboxyvinyltransferase [Natronogracilivirga saccharolytica]